MRRYSMFGGITTLCLCLLLVLSGCGSTSAPSSASKPTPTSTPAGAKASATATSKQGTSPSAVSAILAQPTAGNQRVKVSVASDMRGGAFEQDRYLNVPPHMQISVYTRIPKARFMAVTPAGDLLVSVPDEGKVDLVRANQQGNPDVSTFVSGLRRPQDIVFHTIGQQTYVYISETNQIDRFLYQKGDTQAHDRQIVVTGLPDSSSPELHGAYGHELKNIALDSNNKLYVSIASTCNACLADTQSNPLRGAIYQYNADGTQGHLYAHGLRNAEGLAFVPGTNQLWVAVNNRDNILYPHQDATGQYQQRIPAYVDNHPPEEFTHIQEGSNYGWPFCNPNPNQGVNHMPFDRDVEFNVDGHVNCDQMQRIDKGIQAHSAPLGLVFLQDPAAPNPQHTGALISLHGSWNRTVPTGYKVIYFPWNNQSQQPGQQIDLVTGWQDNTSVWGRPVDTAIDQQGNIFISDDLSGTVYKLTYQA
ncbi:PQQ-dependent sugar dehydrogenase [Dictyobacter halimunensis]